MRFFFYLCVCLFGTFSILGQGTDAEIIKKAEELYAKGKTYRFKNKDSAYYYYDKSYRIFKEQQDWLSSVFALKGISYTCSFHYDLKKYKHTLDQIDLILNTKSEYFDTIAQVRAIKNHNLVEKANYYSKIKNHKQTRHYATRLRKIIEKLEDSVQTKGDIRRLCMALEFEADSYKHEGEYTRAEELYKKSLRIISKNLNEEFALPTYRLLGDLYRKQGDYIRSNEYLKKKLNQEIKKGSSSKNRVIKSCIAIADNHVKIHNNDSVRYYLDIANRQLLKEDPLEFQYHEVLGKSYLSQGMAKKAIVELDSSITLLIANNPKYTNIELVRLLNLKAKAFDQNGNYDKALNNYKKALTKLSINFSSEDLGDNPKPETVQNKLEYLKVLIEKSKTLKKVGDLKATLKTSKMAVMVMDQFQLSFQNEEDRQFLIENFYSIFETGLSTAFELYQKTSNNLYIEEAFFISEKSKSSILLQALLNSRAYRFSNIPDDLLEEEQQLKALINYLQKKVSKTDGDQKWEEQLFTSKTKYRDLILDFENKFPTYYNLKYNTSVVKLGDFQNKLEDHTLAISYFYGNDALYIITTSNTDKEFISIPVTKDLHLQILEVYNGLRDFSSELIALQEKSKKLYDKIIKPLIPDAVYTNLIIMPDGVLNYIPFESLYDGTNYLIENSAIGYVNSATLFLQLKSNEVNNKEVLAFAPSFSKKYAPLANTDIDAQNLLSYFKGIAYKGTEATLEKFRDKSSSYGILHLATHAILDDIRPENSQLIFTPKLQEEKLYVRDIYAMNINASLVSLSACETGIGSLKKGEGMISLSRAFFYAGASSIMSTKWKINNRSTSDIMKDFYKELSRGKRKDEALRLAKINFLQKNYDNGYRHPYFWSGSIISGDTLAIKETIPVWVWVILLLVFVISIGFWKFKKTSP